MNKEISLLTLWEVFLGAWRKMVIVALVAVIAMGVFTQFLITKKYSSSVDFYVINKAPADYVTNSVVSVSEQLANDYIAIIKSDAVMKPIAETLKSHSKYKVSKEYSSAALKKMLSATTIVDGSSSTFSIKVTSSNKNDAYAIAQAIMNESPDILKAITKTDYIGSDLEVQEMNECVRCVNEPVLATSHDSPSLMKNVTLAGAAAFVIVYVIALVSSMFSRTIRSEDDMKEIIAKYPLLCSIPSWE